VKPVFLDTAGLVAVVNSNDHWHSNAISVWSELVRGKCLGES